MYIDDMFVKSQEIEDHITDLTKIFTNLQQYQIKLNHNKYAFGVTSDKFLGFMVPQYRKNFSPINHLTWAMHKDTPADAGQEVPPRLMAEREFGGQSSWEWLAADPARDRIFNDGMAEIDKSGMDRMHASLIG